MKVKPGLFIVMVLTQIIVLDSLRVAQGAGEAIALTLPGIQWAMKIKAPGFALDQRRAESGGKSAYFMASNKATGVVLSGRMENRGRTGTAKEAREYFWEGTKKAPFKMEDIRMSESDRVPTIEYLVREFQGTAINQKNLWAYFTKDQYWVNLHISKTNFSPGEETLFKPILESVSFEDKTPGKKVETRYRVPDVHVLTLDVPYGWQDEIQQPKGDPGPTIVFRPEKMPASDILVTPMWSPQQEEGFNSAQRIREILEEGGRAALAESVEKELTFRKLQGNSGTGWYFTLTDKASHTKPGEYKYMTQGGIGVGHLLVMFTIFTNDKDSADIPAALEMFGHAVQD
jgi:hypothetical protein